MPYNSSRKRGPRLLIIGGLVAFAVGATTFVSVGGWASRAFAWYTVGRPASVRGKQAFVLNPANQPAILQACRTMLASPGTYRQRSGDAFPQKLPPALASLGAASVTVYPEGVLITFDGGFGSWAVPANATAPHLPSPTVRPLIPGLWYVAYPGR